MGHFEFICCEIEIFAHWRFGLTFPCFPWHFLYHIPSLVLFWFSHHLGVLMASLQSCFHFEHCHSVSSMWLIPVGWQPNLIVGQRQDLLGERHLVGTSASSCRNRIEGKCYYPIKIWEILVDMWKICVEMIGLLLHVTQSMSWRQSSVDSLGKTKSRLEVRGLVLILALVFIAV